MNAVLWCNLMCNYLKKIKITCGGNGVCINTGGSYECVCDQGYKFVSLGGNHDQGEGGGSCVDIDECNTNEYLSTTKGHHPCGSHGDCINQLGSYRCHCHSGFMPSSNGTNCEDVDECSLLQPCLNGVCSNLDGSYECSCAPGFHTIDKVSFYFGLI